MLKLIIPLLSFLMGNAKSFFKEPSMALTQQLILHVRALTVVLAATVGFLAISCVGFCLFIVSIAGQVDRAEDFHITGGMGIYLTMTVLSFFGLFMTLRRETWVKAVRRADEEKPKQKSGGSAIENAIALLVMDFVEERQSRRKKETPTE